MIHDQQARSTCECENTATWKTARAFPPPANFTFRAQCRFFVCARVLLFPRLSLERKKELLVVYFLLFNHCMLISSHYFACYNAVKCNTDISPLLVFLHLLLFTVLVGFSGGRNAGLKGSEGPLAFALGYIAAVNMVSKGENEKLTIRKLAVGFLT